jgi:hypothetical protein
MPSYIYRRQLAPSQTRETLDEVRARLIEELRLRTEERVSHWNQLRDWCRQRSGRYISINWRPDLGSSSSSAVVESVAEVTGAGVENSIGSSSSATSNTDNIGQVGGGVEAEELNFESSAELGDEALNEFWDLWDIQKELRELIEIENSKEKSVVESNLTELAVHRIR